MFAQHPSTGIITALIGPSGCGKTTLLRCFNRINERYGNVTTTGEIKILGKNIYDPDVSLSRTAQGGGHGLSAAQPAADLGLRKRRLRSAHSQRTLGAAKTRSRCNGRDGAKRGRLWDDLKDRLQAHATTLQLEQQQKLCIARLLPLKPEVILMDEPCSALDVDATRAIEELMLGSAGATRF